MEGMIKSAGIGPANQVLDLGSGKGLVYAVIIALTGVSCAGVDLTLKNVAQLWECAQSQLKSDLWFLHKSAW